MQKSAGNGADLVLAAAVVPGDRRAAGVFAGWAGCLALRVNPAYRRRGRGGDGRDGMEERLLSCRVCFSGVFGVLGERAGECEILTRKVQEERKIG